MKNDDLVYIVISCLRYESRPTRVLAVTRKRFFKYREDKGSPEQRDLLIQRVSFTRYQEEKRAVEREDFNSWYDKKIREKYNVGPGWKDNRYFLEQVRPSLY